MSMFSPSPTNTKAIRTIDIKNTVNNMALKLHESNKIRYFDIVTPQKFI
jgi:hypothetical protein